MKTSIQGTYKVDPKTGKVVKVSDRIPKVASKGKGSRPAPSGGGMCGKPACARGVCAG